ncbi:hypothetical protein Agub_g10621 [Astrephomene gubernaculifera]|uniref:GTP cyclohydrolase II n=1 Tax=Astrephomene gubernaculifera TaxID=47775 RepID=A0AAD3HPZ5_9CHLO|nr:hypothetical protein Agub_g10621 [Astrephomene gubernaculifera]
MATHERILSHKAASCSHVLLPLRAGRCKQRRLANARRWLGPQLARDVIIASAAYGDALDSERISSYPPPSFEPTPHDPVDENQVVTKFIAETLLPTRHGKFRLRGYKHSTDGGVTFTEPTAIIAGQVEGRENVPLRVHDACFTSEVLGSLKCDCAEQLQLALQLIASQQPGLVIYLQQEGRGIGLANKIAAYSLQEQGLDTVDANRALGLPDDCREYTSVRNMLAELGVRSVRLITNNPRKINVLTSLGIRVTGRIPCLVAAGAYNQGYLEAKRDRMAHMLPEEAAAAAVAAAGAAGVAASSASGTTAVAAEAGQAAAAAAAASVAAVAGSSTSQGGEGELGRLRNPHGTNTDTDLLLVNGSSIGGSMSSMSSMGSIGGEVKGEFCFWDHGGEPIQAVSAAQAKGGMDLPAGLVHGSNGRVVPLEAARSRSSRSGSNGNGNGNGNSSNGVSRGSCSSGSSNSTEGSGMTTAAETAAGAEVLPMRVAAAAAVVATTDGGTSHGGSNGNGNGHASL